MKQMWDKKKLEEMIEEGGSSVTVDSELSDTSENPVQNKVITEAILGGLPDPTGHDDEFLTVNSGVLSWRGGGKKYLHFIRVYPNSYQLPISLIIVNESNTLFDYTGLASYLYNNGNTEEAKSYPVFQVEYIGISNSNIGLNILRGLYSGNGTTIYYTILQTRPLNLVADTGTGIITASLGSMGTAGATALTPSGQFNVVDLVIEL